MFCLYIKNVIEVEITIELFMKTKSNKELVGTKMKDKI